MEPILGASQNQVHEQILADKLWPSNLQELLKSLTRQILVEKVILKGRVFGMELILGASQNQAYDLRGADR